MNLFGFSPGSTLLRCNMMCNITCLGLVHASKELLYVAERLMRGSPMFKVWS